MQQRPTDDRMLANAPSAYRTVSDALVDARHPHPQPLGRLGNADLLHEQNSIRLSRFVLRPLQRLKVWGLCLADHGRRAWPLFGVARRSMPGGSGIPIVVGFGPARGGGG